VKDVFQVGEKQCFQGVKEDISSWQKHVFELAKNMFSSW
jgi:hypothetical protein